MKKITLTLLKIYKRALSPVLVGVFGHSCRFTPTCGEYGREAVERFGVGKGLWMAAGRFLRCHPFSRGYYDPVPRETSNY